MSAVPRVRFSPNVAAVIVLVVVAAGVLLWQAPWRSPEPAAVVPVPPHARAALADQLAALSEAATEDAFVEAAGAGRRAESFARQAWSARQQLDVTDVALRYVRGGDFADRADGSTLAQVEVSWDAGKASAVAGADVRSSTVGLRLDPGPDGTFSVRGAEAVGEPVPLWLAGRIGVQGAGAVRVIAVDGGIADFDPLKAAQRAARAVRDVVSDAQGPLTVVAPATQELTAALVGQNVAEVAHIAGVATTVDGTSKATQVVVLNPALFASMDARARQVLVTHEAAHLMTGAVGASMPPWVAEGFADHVALRRDDAPLTVSAGQVLRRVRADGAPQELPDAAAFAASDGHGLGAVYESAWLVFRMLADDVPEPQLVAFYEDVRDGDDVDVAAQEHLGASVEQITKRWRSYLEKSASTVS